MKKGHGMKRMRRCKACGAYVLDREHCGAETQSPHPPKYSVDDKYAAYRREAAQTAKK